MVIKPVPLGAEFTLGPEWSIPHRPTQPGGWEVTIGHRTLVVPGATERDALRELVRRGCDIRNITALKRQ